MTCSPHHRVVEHRSLSLLPLSLFLFPSLSFSVLVTFFANCLSTIASCQQCYLVFPALFALTNRLSDDCNCARATMRGQLRGFADFMTSNQIAKTLLQRLDNSIFYIFLSSIRTVGLACPYVCMKTLI